MTAKIAGTRLCARAKFPLGVRRFPWRENEVVMTRFGTNSVHKPAASSAEEKKKKHGPRTFEKGAGTAMSFMSRIAQTLSTLSSLTTFTGINTRLLCHGD
jgi:hypothetical protein